ncbi:MAG: hypothetical protein N3A66_11175, partial [Planctomycetota bacterium]|nr:hypothetical protein [Planctomycetota bacterium]
EALAAAESLELVAEKWQLNMVRKSAHENRDHFYDGLLPLRNRGAEKLENVRALVEILDARGNSIQNSGWVDFGDLAPGQTQEKRFVILRAVAGAEVLVKVQYRQGGQERRLEFSSARGGPPTLLGGESADTAELRLLGYEFEQPGIGKGRSSEGVLVIRVRNLAAAPARNPTARLEFLLSGGKGAAKASPPKTASGSKQEAAAPAKNVKVIEVLLDDKEIPPGATRVFEKKVKGVPEYAGMNIILTAEWPADLATPPAAATPNEGDGKIKVASLKIEPAADGTAALRLTIVNQGDAIAANRLKLTIAFLNDQNQTLAKVQHICAEEFPSGKTVEVVIAGQKIPPHAAYDVAIEF